MHLNDLAPEIVVQTMEYLNPLSNDLKAFSLTNKKMQTIYLDSKHCLNSTYLNYDDIISTNMDFKEKSIQFYITSANEKITRVNPFKLSTNSIFFWENNHIHLRKLNSSTHRRIPMSEEDYKNSSFYLNGSLLAIHEKDSSLIKVHNKKEGKFSSKYIKQEITLPDIKDEEKIGTLYTASPDLSIVITENVTTKMLHIFNTKLKQHIRVQINSAIERIGINNDCVYLKETTSNTIKTYQPGCLFPITIHLQSNVSLLNYHRDNLYLVQKKTLDTLETFLLSKVNIKEISQSQIEIKDLKGILRIRPIDERYTVLIETINKVRTFKLRLLDFQKQEVVMSESYSNIVKLGDPIIPTQTPNSNSIQVHCGDDEIRYVKRLAPEEQAWPEDNFIVKSIKFKSQDVKKKSK